MKLVLATVVSNMELMTGHYLLRVTAPYIAAKSKPGQFITINCGKDFILRRPLSIHRVENQRQIAILFAVRGAGTEWLSKRLKGEKLDLLGPLGHGFDVKPTTKKLLLAAGGVGIAPLVFAAEKLLGEGRSVTLLLGARRKDGLYPRRLLPKGIKTVITTEDGSAGIKGKLTDIIPQYIGWADQVYACGPLAMYQSIANQSKQWQDKKQIQVSLEVRMGCGIGACFSCSIKTKKGMKQVCRDGPIFNLDEVILEEVKI